MILTQAAAAFMTVMRNENFCKADKQITSFIKSKLFVVVFHTIQVKEQQDRFLSLSPHTLPAGFRQLEEITHIRQTGKLVVVVSPEQGAFMQRFAESFVQPVFRKVCAFYVTAFVMEPYNSKAHTCFCYHMFATGVDDPVFVFQFDTVNCVVRTVF